MNSKTYLLPNGKTAVFEYDHNGVGKITLECMDMLMGQLIAYKRCIQSRSFWDTKHCDGCIFYDDCPFNPREDEDEPQTSGVVWTDTEIPTYKTTSASTEPQQVTSKLASVENSTASACESTMGQPKGKLEDEPQTDCSWK